MSEYITVKEAAQILGISEATVRNLLLKQKLFKARRIGKQLRINKESFFEFFEYLEKTELE